MKFDREKLEKTIQKRYINMGISIVEAASKAKADVEAMFGEGNEAIQIPDSDFDRLKDLASNLRARAN